MSRQSGLSPGIANELERVHNVFHISQLWKYVHDESHVLELENINLNETLSYEEKSIKILDHKVPSTRNKDIKIVKVLWRNQRTEEATWEAEDVMRLKYRELFQEVSELQGRTFLLEGRNFSFNYVCYRSCDVRQLENAC